MHNYIPRLQKHLLVFSRMFRVRTSHHFACRKQGGSPPEAMCAGTTIQHNEIVTILRYASYLIDYEMYVFGGGPGQISIGAVGAIGSHRMRRGDDLNVKTSAKRLEVRDDELLFRGRP